MKHGKKYLESAKLIESNKLYDPEEAVKLALQTAKTKFDETMEISVRLGVDPRQADQQVRGAVVLPHGTGKKVRVLVFAKGEQAKPPRKPALITLALKSWLRRSRAKTGSISTLSSRPRT